MFPVVLGVGAWLTKGVALATVVPRIVKAAREFFSPAPTPSMSPSPAEPHEVFRPSGWSFIVYSYDNLSQLIGVDINSTRAATFDFDPSGNLQTLTLGNTTTTFTHNSLNQRTSPGTNLYDAKGQTKDQAGRQFEWDDDGRCTAIIMGTHRSEFAYDGYGRRVRITEKENNVVQSDKLYFWLGGQIVCERDATQPGSPVVKRFFGQGVIQGSTKLYYTFDQLGSVRELVDSAGVVRADYRYSTYGERTKIAGDLDSDWGWAGLWHHEPSGLDLATYRVYDPEMGRWLSRDPLGEGVDLNLYRYCGNDPVGLCGSARTGHS